MGGGPIGPKNGGLPIPIGPGPKNGGLPIGGGGHGGPKWI